MFYVSNMLDKCRKSRLLNVVVRPLIRKCYVLINVVKFSINGA